MNTATPATETPASPFALRVAYYAAVAEADEVRTAPGFDCYDRLSATNRVHDARVLLDEVNFLRAAIAVDADAEGRWADASALPAVVEFDAARAPVTILTLRARAKAIAPRLRPAAARKLRNAEKPWTVSRAAKEAANALPALRFDGGVPVIDTALRDELYGLALACSAVR